MPGILIAVVAATVLVGALDLAARAGVQVLGALPQGLPHFAVPRINPADLGPILIGGFAVALVSFADTSVLSRAYAARTHSYVDPNQEMVGLGAANLAAGLFQGFPISSSSSRTPVAEAAGARTQLTGVVGALTVAPLLIVAPHLLRNLPNSALAGIVIASAMGLFEVADLRRIFRIQRWEFWLSIVCYGRRCSARARSPASVWPLRLPSSNSSGMAGARTGLCSDASMASTATMTSSAIPRPDWCLAWCCFAGMRPCSSPTPSCSRPRAGRRRHFADAGALAGHRGRTRDQRGRDRRGCWPNWTNLACRRIDLRFAEMKDPVKDKLKRFGLFARLGETAFFPTIGAAVSSYLATHPVDWVDWEDKDR